MIRRGLRLMAVGAALAATQVRAQPACPALDTRDVVIAGIDDRLELRLDDGGLLRLFGVAPAAAGAPASPPLAGRAATIEMVDGSVDRWGRQVGRAYVAPAGEPDAPPDDLAGLWVAQGVARVRPEPGAPACLAALLAAEAQARAAGRGLWADPANAILDSRDRAALAAQAGADTIVEGVAVSLGETSSRLYLNFGPIRSVDFAVSVAKPAQKAFAANGIDLRALVGARLRARGLIELRPGPSMDIAYPSALEVVSPRPAARQ